jgi:hypothetical protein
MNLGQIELLVLLIVVVGVCVFLISLTRRRTDRQPAATVATEVFSLFTAVFPPRAFCPGLIQAGLCV